MNTAHQLSVDEASRLAVTATVADLEDWARGVAVEGQLELDELIDVLDILRAASLPQVDAARLPDSRSQLEPPICRRATNAPAPTRR